MHHPVGVESDQAANPNGQASSSRRHALALLATILLVALPIRLYLAAAAAMLSRDSGVFIYYARGLAESPLAELKKQAQHPLYPAMMLGMQRLQSHLPGVPADPVRSWALAGVTVTLIGGLALVAAVYALARLLFDARTGLIAAALAAAAAEFCQLSADALTDMPHLALYVFGLAAAIGGVRRRSYGWVAGAGVLSGLAFLTRPEGASVAVVTAGLLVLPGIAWPRRARLVGLAVLIGTAALIASPYMLATSKLIPKKSLGKFVPGLSEVDTSRDEPQRKTAGDGVASGRPSQVSIGHRAAAETREQQPQRAGMSADVPRALGRIAENYVRSLRLTFLLPAVVWLAWRRRKPADRIADRFAIAAGGLHVFILVLLLIRFDYWEMFSLRHVLVPAALTLPFSAAGIALLLDVARPDRRYVMASVLAVVLVGPTLPWMLQQRNADKAYLREAGEWVRAHNEGSAKVMAAWHLVSFYADGRHVPAPARAEATPLLAEVRTERPDWLVLDRRRRLKISPRYFEELQSGLIQGEQLEQLHVAGGNRDGAIVYRYRPAP